MPNFAVANDYMYLLFLLGVIGDEKNHRVVHATHVALRVGSSPDHVGRKGAKAAFGD